MVPPGPQQESQSRGKTSWMVFCMKNGSGAKFSDYNEVFKDYNANVQNRYEGVILKRVNIKWILFCGYWVGKGPQLRHKIRHVTQI